MSGPTRARIALIGPVPPYRGGIAQHTLMLSRALSHKAELLLISFDRQYPGWLYPGKSNHDPSVARLPPSQCRYLLDSLDPLSWRRTADAIVDNGADASVIPWWTVYWTPCFAYLSRRLRAKGVPVIFLCHNVVDHEAAAWKRALTRLTLAAGSGFIVQSSAEWQRLIALKPNARILVHPHPIYTQYPEPAFVPSRRAPLELLFFGIVRDYKGLDVLLNAYASANRSDAMLTIAGEFWSGRDAAQRIIDEAGLGGQVELIDRYVADDEAAGLFTRADAVVLPYRQATGSGVLALAYRYRKPVIASRVPGLMELVREGETGVLVEPRSVEALAAAITAMSAERAVAMAPAIADVAATLTWDSLADAVLRLARESRARTL